MICKCTKNLLTYIKTTIRFKKNSNSYSNLKDKNHNKV